MKEAVKINLISIILGNENVSFDSKKSGKSEIDFALEP